MKFFIVVSIFSLEQNKYDMENFGTATKRQRWALYCLTHTDYRQQELSKEDAAALIAKLMKGKTVKKSKKTIEDELVDYLHEHWDEVMNDAMPSMNEKSIVETEMLGQTRRFAFIGVGCGITYLTHRKGNKKAEAIKAAANKLHFGLAQTWFLKRFTEEDKAYYDKIGCPLGAIWQQDMNMQQAYYYKVLDFARMKGVNMSVKSFLD